MIKKVTIVTNQGVKEFEVGKKCPDKDVVIESIKMSPIIFTGDPYDHYTGWDKDKKMLFSINCLVPCEVIYN